MLKLLLMVVRSRLFLACILFGAPSAAFAQCRAVEVGGPSVLIGQFPFDNAYRDCVKVYKNHYLPKHRQRDSDLQLECHGAPQTIAYYRKGQYFETGIQIAGCALPKTMG